MSEMTAWGTTSDATAKVIVSREGNKAYLATGITPGDLELENSDDGQYLLIYCGDEAVLVYGAMGGSVSTVEFADGRRYSAEELLDLVSRI